MAAGDAWPGRRLPTPPSGDVNDIYSDIQPGDYVGPMVHPTSTDKRPYVAGRLPDGRHFHVCTPPWDIVECPYGTLTIGGSILITGVNDDGTPYRFHGYLLEGVWSEID